MEYKKIFNIPITGIKTDSREIKEGDLFVAVKGYNIDHSKYIKDAIKNGASAVVTEKRYTRKVPCFKVKNINQELINICKQYYKYDNELDLIGVVGTDGKTTTATILKNSLNNFDSTAYIGTNGIEFKEKNISTQNTTPKIEELYKFFSYFKRNNCKKVVMEVSSEALLHDRVKPFKFKYIVFTNITEDHLNIHKTIENYINCKLKILDNLEKDGIVILNKDDNNLNKVNIKNKKVYTYGKNKNSDFIIFNIKYKSKKTTFKIKYKNKIYKINSPYPFEYNIYNLTAAFIICLLENLKVKKVITNIKNLPVISGRCEYLNFTKKYKIILDYAHTENGIKNLIQNVKKYNQKIIVVTGQAGGREVEKRSKIGNYLLNNVDLVVFTEDDPRNENVDDIINQMIGDNENNNYVKITEREKAITYALEKAEKNNYVIILGKGRDNYMAIGNKKIPYSDYEVIKKYFSVNN